MEAHKNKDWGDGRRTYTEGMEVDCRQWKSFRVAGILFNGVKIEYRLRRFDKGAEKPLQFKQPVNGLGVSDGAMGTESAVANATHTQQTG